MEYSQGAPNVNFRKIGTLRYNDEDGNENSKNNYYSFCKQNNNFARASLFFVHFFARFCTTTT